MLAGDPPFRFVGDGPASLELQALATALGLRRTRFEGRVATTDIEPFLRDARFVSFPSRWNENAALEAMATGPFLIRTKPSGSL